jgi:hypothetical protein
MGQTGQDPSPIAGVSFATASTSMIHVPKDLVSIQDDLMRGHTLDVGHKANPAGILL